jgi:hypothetical protein
VGNGTLEKSARAACALALAVLSGPAWATLKVETVTGRGTTPTDALVARAFVDAHKRLESGARAHGYKGTFFFPQRVELFANGQKLPFKGQASRSGDLTLSFASSGPTAFDPSYQSLLQSVFASAKPVMDTVFGKAAVGGTIKVVNDDATISDRRAVLGGYYVPNAPGGPEIRLPVNLDQNTAAVNFVHAMLLAYQGPKAYPFDAYNEGLVRAATVVVMRTVSSNSAQVENVLNNLYEADDRYDWLNQPALSAEPFIAPNLLLANLPAGGSTGGIYLLRHQMAGSAWEKVLTEYPTFAAQFNQAYYASPSSYTSSALLESLAVSAVNSIVGTSSGRIEGLPVRSWIFRQWILSPQTTAGLKLLLEPSPLTPLNSGDFGVFDLALHAFTTDASGNETLLSGTSYPVFFRPDFTRFFTSAQDDVVSVSNGYGSVAPNFPSATFGTAPYKVVIDAPFGAKTQRVNLPAGAVYDSNGLRLQASGTVSGFGTNVANMTVRLTWAGGDSGDISVQNGAFGASISSTTFEKAQPVTVVLKQGTTTVLTRQINKGRGPLVTDLKAPATDATFNWTFANRLAFLGFPLDPFRPYAREVFGLDPTAVLVARYDPTLGRYVYFPDESEVRIGLGYFVRPFDTTGRVVSGRGPGSDPVVVSLKAGWNMVTNPTPNAVNVANIQVATTTQPFLSWATASGDLVGSAVFSLTPDSTHPDGGTLTPVTTVNPGQGVYVRCLSSQGADLLWGASSPAKTGQKLAAPLAAGEWRSKLSVTGDMFQSSSVELGQQKIGSATANERNDVLLPPGAGGFQAAVEAGATFYRKVFPMTQTLPVRVTLSNLIPGRWYTVNAVTEGKTGVSVALPSGITATLTTGRQTRFKATSTTATLGVRAL